MFFLDVSPEEAASRIAKDRRQTEMFESLNALRKIRAKALALTRFSKWTIIDSNKPIALTAQQLSSKLFNEKDTEEC